jgi:molecular chaperone DnaK
MVKDAEAHAEEDRLAKELVEARNMAENMIPAPKKSRDDLVDKVEDQEKTDIEAAIAALEEELKGSDKDAITEKTTKLTEVAGKLAEKAYAEEQGAAEGGEAPEAANSENAADDDIVDAEFEEVEDENK